jgi:hypothetical protein
MIYIGLAEQSGGQETVKYARLAIAQFESFIKACKPTPGNTCHWAEQGMQVAIGVLLSKGQPAEATAAAIRFVSILRKWLEILPRESNNEFRLRAL